MCTILCKYQALSLQSVPIVLSHAGPRRSISKNSWERKGRGKVVSDFDDINLIESYLIRIWTISLILNASRLVVDIDKPRNFGLWFMDLVMVNVLLERVDHISLILAHYQTWLDLNLHHRLELPWLTFLCSFCPHGLVKSSWHSGALRPFIWTMFSSKPNPRKL